MKPGIDARQLHAFVDGELDLKSQLEIEERLRAGADARAQVEALRQLKQAVRENADYHAAPAALRMRLATGIAAPASSLVGSALQRWFGWRPMLVSFGVTAALALILNVAWLRATRVERVMQDVVASHVRSTVGQHLVDVASSDHHTVKPWLSSKLGFSPPVSELKIPGAEFLGGRVDYLDGRPVAALAYRQGEHVVNSFLWPTDTKDRAVAFSTERGFQIARWARGGMNHWVISDISRNEFIAVVRALESADAVR